MGHPSALPLGSTVNTVKAGNTMPLKFEVFAASELTNTSVAKSFTVTELKTTETGQEDAIEMTTTGGTALRYDSTGGQFVQNWQTPKAGVGKDYRVTVTLQDGTPISATFRLK